ncbi:hypothetical protein TKK_0011866 [Trichogramma kaykai]
MVNHQLPVHQRSKDGRLYVICRTTPLKYYLKCKNTRSSCKGTAQLRRDVVNAELEERQEHAPSCIPDDDAINIAIFRQALRYAMRTDHRSPRLIYDTYALVYDEGASLLPYPAVSESMINWRKKSFPPSPASIQEMVRQLQDPLNEGIFNHEKGHLSNQVLRDSDNCAHFVFWDEDFIRRVAPHLSILFVDCTYKTCIEIRGENMQLATIMGVFHDHALPLIWFIMSRKTLNAYSRIAATARGILHDSRVQAIVTDFEIGLRNAFRLHFPDAHLVGCMFHFARCLMRKIHQLRLTDYVNNDEAASETVRKIIALSFLPAEQIQENLHAITSSIPNEMFQNLHPFLHYFETFWMGRIGVDNFSLFGIHNRTNNAIESYHSVLLHKLGLHPPFWSWVCKIKTLQLHLWIDLTTMESGRQVARQQSNKTQFKNNVLQRCWRLLYLRHITAAQFLSITAKLIGGYFRRYSQDIPAMDVQAMIELERSFNNNLNLPVNPGGPDPEFDNSIMREFPAHEREWVRQAVLRRIGENNQPNEPVRENAGLVMRVRDERARRRRRRRRREPMINQAADVDARPEAEPAAIQNNLADNAVLGADEVNRPMNQAANVDARPEAVPAAIQNNLADNAALGADEVNRPMNQAADVDARPEAVPAAIQNNLVDNAVLGADEVNRPMNQAADVDARPEAVPAAIQNNLADNDVAHQEPADAVLDDDPMPIIEERRCAVCMIQQKTHLFMPCHHYICCPDCATRIANDPSPIRRICPYCRQRVFEIIRIYE